MNSGRSMNSERLLWGSMAILVVATFLSRLTDRSLIVVLIRHLWEG